MQFLYLIRTDEFTGRNIYKLCGTTHNISNTVYYHGKNTEILALLPVNNIKTAKLGLKQCFAKHYIHRKDIGTNYFEGNIVSMSAQMAGYLTYNNYIYRA